MAQPGHVTIHALRRHALIRDSALPFRDHGLEQCLSGSFQNRHRDGVKPSAMEISIPPGPKVPSLHLAFQFPSRDGEQIPVIPLRLAHIRLVDTAQERTGLPSVPVSSFRRTLVLSSCSGNCRTVVPAPGDTAGQTRLASPSHPVYSASRDLFFPLEPSLTILSRVHINRCGLVSDELCSHLAFEILLQQCLMSLSALMPRFRSASSLDLRSVGS